MKKYLSSLLLILLLGCGSNREQALLKIKTLEKELFANSTGEVLRSKGEQLSELYATFASNFPSDSLAPLFLFKAAELNAGIGKPAEAIKLYETVYTNYPQSKKADYSLFLEAFVTENQLRDTLSARKLYTSFLKKYPSHPLKKDVLFSLSNMGKTDAEILKSIELKR